MTSSVFIPFQILTPDLKFLIQDYLFKVYPQNSEKIHANTFGVMRTIKVRYFHCLHTFGAYLLLEFQLFFKKGVV